MHRTRPTVADVERLQRERVAAFGEFRTDVESGAHPQLEHIVDIDSDAVAEFVASLDADERGAS